MRKSLHELLTYIWIPFMTGIVWYIFRDRHDVPLAILTLIAFSLIYIAARLYFASKKWQWLVAIPVVIIGLVVYLLLRPAGIILYVNGEAVTNTAVSFTEGLVEVKPAPGDDGRYNKDTVVTLTAIPTSGYDWESWTATANDKYNPTTVNMDNRKLVTVTFEPRFSLIINNQAVIGSIVGFPEGSVSVNPAPGEDGKYAKGTSVNLTASAGSGYDWKNWTATSSDTSNPTTVTMYNPKQVTVTFEQRFELTIGNQLVVSSTLTFSEGAVTVNPAPGDDDKYAKGTTVTLTANPASGYGLKTWAGTSSDASNPTIVTVSSDKHVLVTFELRFPLFVNNLAVSSSSANFTGGLVSVNPGPLSDGKYGNGTVVTLTASPASGYRFNHWEGDASGNTTSVAVTMTSGKNVTPIFNKIFTLITSVTPVGIGSVSPSNGTYDDGTSVTLTASPAAGYRFDHWEGDASGNVTAITIILNSNKSVTATFKKTYTLTTSVNPAGSGSVSPVSGNYDDGASVTLTASPAAGYRFDHWEGDASGNTASVSITISSNKTATAVFVKTSP